MTANTLVQGQRVKGQGHSVCKRQRRLTAKSVRNCCLFNVEKCELQHVLCKCGKLWLTRRNSQNVRKRNIFEQQNPENADNTPDRLARSQGGLRQASSCNAFAIARFLVY